MRGLLFCEFEAFLSDHKIYVFIINTVWHFLSSFLSIFTFVIRSILCNKIILLRMKIIIRVKDEKSKAWVCHAHKEDAIDFEILVNPWPILHPHYYSSWTWWMMMIYLQEVEAAMLILLEKQDGAVLTSDLPMGKWQGVTV